MRNLTPSRKLNRQELKQVTGAGKEICCQTVCATGECLVTTIFPVQCPILIPCI